MTIAKGIVQAVRAFYGSTYLSRVYLGNDQILRSVPIITAVASVDNAAPVEGESVTFTVVATGGVGTISYQWQLSLDGASWLEMSGDTESTLTGQYSTAGTRYFRCVVTDADGNSTTSNSVSVTWSVAIQVPAAPTGLTHSFVDSGIVLTWDNPGDSSITSYQYKRWFTDSWKTISGSGSSTVTYTITGLNNGQAYTPYIRAVNNDGSGDAATTGAITIPNPTALAVPGGLNESSIQGYNATISWNAVTNADGYTVRWRQGTGGWITINKGTSTSHNLTNLAAGTEYQWEVKCEGSYPYADSPYSANQSFTTIVGPVLTATTGDAAGEVDLSWTDGRSDTGGWDYRYKLTTQNWGASGTQWRWNGSGTSNTTRTITGLTAGSAYDFQLRSYGGNPNFNVLSAEVEASAGTGDITPPSYASSAVNGASLVITYNENLDTSSVPAASAFTIDKSTGTDPTVSSVAIAGATVTLTLSAAVDSSDSVTVSYAVPSTNPIQDSAGNDAVALTAESVTNNTPAPGSSGTTYCGLSEDATITEAELKAGTTSADGDLKLRVPSAFDTENVQRYVAFARLASEADFTEVYIDLAANTETTANQISAFTQETVTIDSVSYKVLRSTNILTSGGYAIWLRVV